MGRAAVRPAPAGTVSAHGLTGDDERKGEAVQDAELRTEGVAPAGRSTGGPVSPTISGHCVLRPLASGVRLLGGFWGERQARNRNVSIPHGISMLEDSGALWNLRLAAGRVQGPYRLPLYRDANVYVVLEAIAWDRRHGKVEAYEEFFQAATELLAAAQAKDGYLNSYVQVCNPSGRFADPAHGHELFCAGHLIQAAVADSRTGGGRALTEVARRFADYLCDELLGQRSDLVEGHPEIETAFVELYRLTAEHRYLDLALALLDRRGHRTLETAYFRAAYFQDDTPVREAYAIRGHAVRALYLAAGATDCYIETGDSSLRRAMVAQWEDMVSAKTYLTGGLGSRHEWEAFGERFELPADRAYCETCAAIAAIMWSWRMLLVTGEARYATLTERILYNGFAAALGSDGKSYFYVNPLQSQGDHHRQPWYETACCPPNAMRLLASLEDYVATTADNGLQVHQFLPCDLDAVVGQGQLFRLSVETRYPWEHTVTLRIHDAPTTEVAVSFRVPSWSAQFVLELNERPCKATSSALGYATVNRRWQPGDQLTIGFSMSARVVQPHPAIDAIRSSVAVERGPLVYCIEGVDLGGSSMANMRLPGADVVDGEGALTLGGEQVVTLALNAFEVQEPAGEGWPYQEKAQTTQRAVTAPSPRRVEAIPYYAWDRRGASAMRVWVPQLEIP